MNRLLKVFKYINHYRWFLSDYFTFRKKIADDRFVLSFSNRIPTLWEKTANTWFDAHYIYHTAWAVSKVIQINPSKHIDISSTLYFCTNLSATLPVEFYDYRPAQLNLPNLISKKGDLTNLPFANDSVESISCMHTVEHVGLGRYGDPIDPQGDLVAINELKRVTSKGGALLFVAPVGKPKICFNAHRIYAYQQIIDCFEGFSLQESALVTDNNDFLINPSVQEFDSQAYGCGCFWFKKNH